MPYARWKDRIERAGIDEEADADRLPASVPARNNRAHVGESHVPLADPDHMPMESLRQQHG